jgi:DNA topoisomerase I
VGGRPDLRGPAWREQRDRVKHDRALGFGAALPRLRKAVDRHLEGRGLMRDRVLGLDLHGGARA